MSYHLGQMSMAWIPLGGCIGAHGSLTEMHLEGIGSTSESDQTRATGWLMRGIIDTAY